MKHEFTPEEFAKALAEGSLKSPLVVEGLAKVSKQPDQYILFAPGTSCLTWVRVPLVMITKIEWLGKLPCRDHQHDFVRLFLREPKDQEALVFADLLREIKAIQLPEKLEHGCRACYWDGKQYSTGAKIMVYESGTCFWYECQSNGSWRRNGFC